VSSTNSQASAHDAGRYLVFTLEKDWFALPLLSVREVVALPETTRVPYTPPHFLGIMNLRGQIISVFDLHAKFGIKSEQGSETAVIICNVSGLCFGVVVSSVDSVIAVNDTEIKDRPNIYGSIKGDYVKRVTMRDEKLILLIDILKSLDISELKAIKQARTAA
jgi:purine-binding chemotaxis protein CheW